jgi:hypothetical protein
MSKKPYVIMIMDGFGLNDNPKANAVAEATTGTITTSSPVGDQCLEPLFRGGATEFRKITV